MPLTPGTRVGPYEITAPFGVGGKVYRATDTRLKRDVAIKVLPAALASDPDRLARFQREAEVQASLNHPPIAHIHGLEERPADEGPAKAGLHVRALVMEMAAGTVKSSGVTSRLPKPNASSARMI
jgi:serine/threonine-protein kinase